MENSNFLAKIPLFIGVTASGFTWLLIAFFLLQGAPLQPTRPAEFYQQEPVSSPVSWESSEKTVCFKSGGRWVEFPDACVDSCTKARNSQVVCAQVLTVGCDCGVGKCWDENTFTCQPNPLVSD